MLSDNLIRKLIEMSGMLPDTFGPHHEPLQDDEEVTVKCAGFYLGELTAGDLREFYEMSVDQNKSAPCETCEGDVEVCARTPLRHCEKATRMKMIKAHTATKVD